MSTTLMQMKTYLVFGYDTCLQKEKDYFSSSNPNILPLSLFIKMWSILKTSGPFKTKSQSCVLWAFSSRWLIHSWEAWIVWLAYGSTLN